MWKTSFPRGCMEILVKLGCWGGNTGAVAVSQPCCSHVKWSFGCLAPARTAPGVLRNVGLSCAPLRAPLPALPVSPPLSQTGHFPNFSLFLTRLRFNIASWGTHPASNPQAQGSSTHRRSSGLKVLCAIAGSHSGNNQVINGSDCVYCVRMTSLRAPRGNLRVRG